jgi:hypothetical protein
MMTTSAAIDRDLGSVTERAKRSRRFLRAVLTLAVLLVLPFLVLLRGSMWLYLSGGTSTWGAVVGGAGLALVAVVVLGTWVSKRLTGRARARFVAKWIALPLVVVYVGQALLYFSTVNAKTDAVRSYYTSMHPLLRVAVATLVLVDGDVVVTDMAREPADYRRMGLPTADWSMHFRQADGWVHAMDLRTIGRSGIRNFLTGGYFRLLGFRVLRHVGTADHLHVSLPLPGASGTR